MAGESWIINAGDTFQFPAGPTNGDTVLTAPANSDWSTLGASFATTDTATIDPTVAVAGADAVTWVYEAAGDTWLKFLGSGSPTSFLYFTGQNSLGNSSTVPAVAFDTKAHNAATLDANWTMVFTNPPDQRLVTLQVTQDAVGSRTIVFPASVLGSPPQPNLPALASTVYLLLWDGVNYHF